jgi:hypothetical protein
MCDSNAPHNIQGMIPLSLNALFILTFFLFSSESHALISSSSANVSHEQKTHKKVKTVVSEITQSSLNYYRRRKECMEIEHELKGMRENGIIEFTIVSAPDGMWTGN